MKVPYIDIVGQHKELYPEIERSIRKVFRRGDFVSGEEVGLLEKKFAQYCGTKYAVALNSGTDALFLSMKALGIGRGDEVITCPNSFLASATSIIASGAKPVFCDVLEDQGMDPNKLEEAITKNTKAIMPVHLTGKVADMRQILKIAKKHNLYVIEDAAQAIGGEYRGRRAGSFGTMGCFSLHPLKTLNACGDGGMITTNDEKLDITLRQLRNIGLKNRDESDIWGYNSRLDTIQAAIVLTKFKYLDRWINRRRKNAAFYTKHLRGVVVCPGERGYERHSYHVYVIQTDRRDELKKYLATKDVDTKVHYPIPIHLQKVAKRLNYKRGDFPVAERQAEQILSLPIHQYLSQKQLTYVVKMIKLYCSRST